MKRHRSNTSPLLPTSKRPRIHSPKSPPSSTNHGKIAVGGKSRRGGIGYAKAAHETAGFLVLPIISRGKKPYNQLSPFNLGPVRDTVTGLEARNMENWWQFLKVYPKVAKQSQKKWKWPEEVHATWNGDGEAPDRTTTSQQRESWKVLDTWTKWRDAGFKHTHAIRHPNGTVRKNGPPAFSYYNGRRLGYIEARKVLYVPFYKELVRESPVYQDILQQVRAGQNVMLIDVDGPNVNQYPNARIMSETLLEELLNDTSSPYGHGYACSEALMEDLKGENVVEQTEVPTNETPS